MKFLTLSYLFICLSIFLGCRKPKTLGPDSNGPVITAFTPVYGIEGTVVNILGSNFSKDAAKNTVTLAGVNIQPISATSTQMTIAIPSGIAPGDYRFSVKVGNTTSSSLQSFTLKDMTVITDPEILSYNYSLGTQTIGPSYGFTSEDRLIETSKAILDMGSNILKISLDLGYNITGRPNYANLTSLVRDDPSFNKVIDLPFTYYFFWAKSEAKWKDGYSTAERTDDSTQIANLTKYLLTKFNNTGKKFFIGHWEGDWYLLDNFDTNFVPSDTRINGNIQWLRCRQNAVDEAKKVTSHTNVEVFTYCEVNRVVDAMNGKSRVVNKVLPFTNVDYVSYSAYDAQSLNQSEYNNVLNYIQSNLPSRPLIKGKRVFIGEMGRNALSVGFSKTEHELVNRQNIRKAISWGAPFVLYWAMYNNEIVNGVQNGYWLIDDKNEKWPLYYTYQNFYSKAKIWVASQKKTLNRLPTREEYMAWASNALLNP